ncbi:hypothetical protein MJO63_24100 [Mycobacterium ulcerans]|uniref:Thioesterase domain-containing protein n=2 Tax=Mycobacterium ulcerans TaxID=1809 RepID=A0ABY3V5W7_MYCUL|nr:hypothetical protein [Mycobacterium ulcerans]UDM34405.1 hypothetical protein LH162_24100 [Mycobacterium ulcerans]ULP51712.1 hypothetical protein MJO63_24100 [Mycobacterium ulcerans]
MDLMLPIARADLTACEEYLYRPAPPLSCPITALGGVGDVTFDQSELTRWGEMTSATFEVVAMPGGHFFCPYRSRPVVLARRGLSTRARIFALTGRAGKHPDCDCRERDTRIPGLGHRSRRGAHP